MKTEKNKETLISLINSLNIPCAILQEMTAPTKEKKHIPPARDIFYFISDNKLKAVSEYKLRQYGIKMKDYNV